MGTRAVIRVQGHFIATHWDGNPSSLGEELDKSDRSLEAVLEIAKGHTIDFISEDLLPQVEDERFQHIVDRANANPNKTKEYTLAEVKDMYKTTGKIPGQSVMSADDWPIEGFKDYNDWACYEYDIRSEGIFVRSLSGPYREAQLRADEREWLPIKKALVKAQQGEI